MTMSSAGEPRARSAWPYLAAALGLTLAAVGVAYLFGTTPAGRSVERVVHDAVIGLRDEWWWRPMRGGLGHVVPAASVVAIAGLMVLVHRRFGAAITVGAAIVVVGSNLTDQAVKHGVLPFPPSARPGAEPLLSGHPPLVLSVAMLLVLVAPMAARRYVGVVVVAGAALVGLGVVLSGWHTVGEVLVPMLMFASWAGVGAAYAVGHAMAGGRSPRDARRGSGPAARRPAR